MDPYDDAYSNVVLVPCKICGRSFAQQVLAKHQPICNKNSHRKQRKAFDSSKQRAEGTEINTVRRRAKAPPPRKNNWRQKHEDFVSTIRAARGVQAAMERGGPLPPPPPPSHNPDYIQCDYCGRRFAEQAAQRHINFCKEKNQRLPAGRGNQATAAQKQAVRTQYQPPKPKKAAPSGSGYGGGQSGMGAGSRNGVRAGPGGQGGMRAAPERNMGVSRLPGTGEVLRTGRTAQAYDEARQLSATQRATLAPQTKRPAANNYGSSQYGYGSGGGAYRNGSAGSGYGNGSAGRGAPQGSRLPVGVIRNGQAGRGKVPGKAGGDPFCFDCGAKYSTPSAKFCMDCGARK